MANNITNIGPVALCGYYIVCMAFELFPGNAGLRPVFASGAVILTLFELIFAFRDGRTWGKSENIAATLLLPLCAVTGFEMSCGYAPAKLLTGILFLLALLLTIPLFMRSKGSGFLSRTGAALFACFMAFLLAMGILFSMLGFDALYRAFSVLSPDGSRAANVLSVDQGTLGGRTYVSIVSRRGEHMPTDGGKELIDTSFYYPEHIDIRWLSDDVLEFQGEKYRVP